MDSDRPPPHRTASTSSTTTTTGDFFICFTARHQFSQRDHPTVSLTTSLSRRLRSNRSIKGGASPALFPSTGKKRSGGGFDNNPEPSSPKVTCIGQVRVKSKKKQGINNISRSLSRKHSSSGGDANSFRKLQHSSDGFSKSLNLGSNYVNQDSFQEQRNHNNNSNIQKWVHFSCFFPCRSSCFSPAKEDKPVDGSGSCGAVCARWFVAVHDGGRRDVELVVENEEDDLIRVSRRHVFDDLEIVNDRIVQGESPRLSICIPPKNALLLMRCRSDPIKMEALANRLWQSTNISQYVDQDDDFFDLEDKTMQKTCDSIQEHIIQQEQILETNNDLEEEEEEEEEEEGTFFGSLFDDEMLDVEQVFEGNETGESNIEKVKGFDGINEEEMVIQLQERSEEMVDESKEQENEALERERLPECLLLMMCEPKLSMEVSKETWVSSKDFFRRPLRRKKPPPPPPPPPQPKHLPVKPIDSQDKSKVSGTTTFASTTFKYDKNKHVSPAAAVQPGRSSCSLPAPLSMAEMIEQKLVNAVGYEPCVLTRCKSEPMRTAAAKLAPDNCFWKNRKLEPLRRATCGVGAAGIGF